MHKPKSSGRDLGLLFHGRSGPHNAITDVAGVAVGFTTLTDAIKQMRTGVTAIVPRQDAGMTCRAIDQDALKGVF